MRMVLVAGVLMLALFVAVVSAVNAECPFAARSLAANPLHLSGPAS